MRAVAGLTLLLLLASGCATVKVEGTKSREYLAARRGDVLNSGRLSQSTTSTLFSHGVDTAWCQQAVEACIEKLLQAEDAGHASDEVLATVSELALARAIGNDIAAAQNDSTASIVRFLNAARYAYAYLFRGGRSLAERSLEERQTQVRDYYNYATERVAQLVFAKNRLADRAHIPKSGDEREFGQWLLVTGKVEVHAPLHATGLDEIVSASDLKFEGIRNTYRHDGFGAELVAVWHVPPDVGASVEIAYHPATVLLGFEGETQRDLLMSQHARLDIFDPYQRSAVDIQAADVSLAGNFTAPYGLWLARSKFHAQGVRAFFGRRKSLDHAEVLMMQPYDPRRLTVVLIHGLAASPDSWVNVANEVMGDERLRDQYQVWQVYYPTNIPVAVSQVDVRKALEQTFATVDPQHVNRASHDVVLVGHSMGGIIARLLVSTGGERIWQERYDAPLGSERRARLARLEPFLDFHPLAGVDRVIFLATPHAGTPFAGNEFSRLMASLVHLPDSLVQRIDEAADSIAGDAPDAARELRQHPNAIRLLDSRDPYLQITQKLGIAPAVSYHSIIARKDLKGPLELSTDGLVPYRSAYLPGAQSTLVITSGHRVQNTAAAVLELRRILILHAAAHPDEGAVVATHG